MEMAALLSQPQILIAHEMTLYSESLAILLAERWRGLDIRLLDPAELEDALIAEPGAIVIASRLTPAVTTHASGWIIYYPNQENVALTGDHGSQRAIEAPRLADIIAAIDGFLFQHFPGAFSASSAVHDNPDSEP